MGSEVDLSSQTEKYFWVVI